MNAHNQSRLTLITLKIIERDDILPLFLYILYHNNLKYRLIGLIDNNYNDPYQFGLISSRSLNDNDHCNYQFGLVLWMILNDNNCNDHYQFGLLLYCDNDYDNYY